MNKYFLIVLISLVGSQAQCMRGPLADLVDQAVKQGITRGVDMVNPYNAVSSGSLDVFLGRSLSSIAQNANSTWTIFGALSAGGALIGKGYSMVMGAQAVAKTTNTVTGVIKEALDQHQEEITALAKLAEEAELLRKKKEKRDEKAQEALYHVNNLSLMELHILAAAEAQEESDSHYWQDLYNAKRGDNPYLALSSNNLAYDKQPENSNNQ